MKIEIEYTDTFGGEANYSWVDRATIEVPDTISNSALTREIKKVMGLSGVRGRMDNLGELKAFRPYRSATVLFWHPTE